MKNNYFTSNFSHRIHSRKSDPPQCLFCQSLKKKYSLSLWIEAGLSSKHHSSQNFYYIREINDICFQRISMYKIRFSEFKIMDDEKENLKRFYCKFEIKGKLQQISAYAKHEGWNLKPKIYLPEFNEIMYVHSLKQLQQVQIKKAKVKNKVLMKKPELTLKIQPFQQFNVLDSLNFGGFRTERKDERVVNEKSGIANSSLEFSMFLKERKIKLEVSQIKKEEEISDISLLKISQFLVSQKKNSIKPSQNSAKLPSSRRIISGGPKSPLLVPANPLRTRNHFVFTTKPPAVKSNSVNDKKIQYLEEKRPLKKEFPPFPIHITPLTHRAHKPLLTDRDSLEKIEKTPRKLVKSTNQSPNTVNHRFFISEKYGGKLGKTEQNFKKHKNMRSEYENKGEKTLRFRKEKKEEFDEYMMLTERKRETEEACDKRLGKSNYFLLLCRFINFFL